MAKSRPDTWMPLFIGDYLADTMHLSTSQHGAYMLLIMAYWRAGAPLPDDDDQLAAIAKCSAAEWKKCRPVIAKFFHCSGGFWSHKRIDAELEGATSKTQERSKAGTEGARKRWQTDGKPHGKPMANPSQTASQTDAPSPSLKGEAKKEPRSETPETVAARGSQNGSGLGRYAPSGSSTDAVPGPPTAEQVAEVDARVKQAVAALNGHAPKGTIAPAAHAAAIKHSKFKRFVRNLNEWASSQLEGEARLAAWETIAIADAAGARQAMPLAARRSLDALDNAYRAAKGATHGG